MASVTIWNRVEPRARSQSLAEGLAARVYDPLWFLTRQWQMGEFAGRDGGSPVTVTATSTATPYDRYMTGAESARPYDNRIPLEALVERETVRVQTTANDLWQAVEAGLQFFRMLDATNLSRLRGVYLTQYPLTYDPDPSLQPMAALAAGRVIDSIRLHADLVAAGGALPAKPALSDVDRQSALPVVQAWRAWYESLFTEPAAAGSWSPVRMEYGCALGASAGLTLCVSKEYDGGSIDWYTFDRAPAQPTGGTATQPKSAVRSGMAAPVTFRGMPARRFWEVEDAAVDIGALSAAAEDLGRLLLREFALIYGNDWFQFPLAVPVGSETIIDSLAVADTFGVTTAIPHYVDVDGSAGAWRMFALAAASSAAAQSSARVLVVTAGAVSPIDGSAIEDVLMLRDEAANMVWGVERWTVGRSGAPVDRALNWNTTALGPQPRSANATPSYRLGSTLPDYWISFLPVAVGAGPLQMRRGKMPTAAAGPLGRFLADPGLTIFSEELPREGVRLQRRYRLARGQDGSTWVWVGRLRSTGQGEGRSGLRFDYLE